MPRISAESRSASLWRGGTEPPKPPKYMSRKAKVVWREIVSARPADFFQPGSLHLLEQFCEIIVAQREVLQYLAKKPGAVELIDRAQKYVTMSTALATKLRLSVQSLVDRKSGMIDEKQPKIDGLIGGQAAWPNERGKLN